MNVPSPNGRGREWLDAPARRVNPPSKLPADLPPAFESGNGYDWCESCGVHFRTEALRRHKKSVIHRANVVQYAQWTAVRSAPAGPTTTAAAVSRSWPKFRIPDEFLKIFLDNLPSDHLALVNDRGNKVFTHNPKPGRPVFQTAATPNALVCRRVNCLRIATLLAMTKKLSDPDFVVDIGAMNQELLPSSLTVAERDEREANISNFCNFKYDRNVKLAELELDLTKPTDKKFVRDYHSWADSLDIQAIKDGDKNWVFGRTAWDRAFGVALIKRCQAQLLE
ncbi:hypothetical protein H9P43_006774 [Blastocladiella emersonii ATCC 22665]|nr:hypothetical protein H9P43_006774 [Blastocladiella emersonii ATCC 22665]